MKTPTSANLFDVIVLDLAASLHFAWGINTVCLIMHSKLGRWLQQVYIYVVKYTCMKETSQGLLWELK